MNNIQILNIFNAINKRLSNLSGYLKILEGVINAEILQNFEKKGRWRHADIGEVIKKTMPREKVWVGLFKKTKEIYSVKGYELEPTLNRTGRLMRSIDIDVDEKNNKIVITTGVKYGLIHNFGGWINSVVKVTKKMRKFFWFMYYRTKSNHWKYMALTKKEEFKILYRMPAREFIAIPNYVIEDLIELIKQDVFK